MAISNENKEIAKHARSVFGGQPTVVKYWDDSHASSVDILIAQDAPTSGVTSYATISLSDHSIELQVEKIPLRVEFVASIATAYKYGPNILATCAFNVINSKMKCGPGQVFPRVVELYCADSDMKHIVLAPPFIWSLKTLNFATKTVAWLFAVPISNNEYAFLRENGSDALERRFEEQQIDIYNLNRKSIL